jgi:AraC family transcriptional activator of pyochelin receptor
MNERFSLFNGALTVSAGTNSFDAPVRVNTALKAGVKVVVLLSGRMQIKIGNAPASEICGPASLVIRSTKETPRDQVYSPGIPVRYALIQMDDEICDGKLGAMLDGACRDDKQTSTRGSTVFLTSSAGNVQQSLARQLMNCPVSGPERGLYLGGKALQLAALTVAQCVAEAATVKPHSLSSHDIEKIHRARDLLVAAMQKPPSLNALAREVGLNVRKLNLGFRRVFGTTVFGFLQEYRLEVAYKLLAGGEKSVSEAAFHVGYGASHFTTIFRKRFGISPSELN